MSLLKSKSQKKPPSLFELVTSAAVQADLKRSDATDAGSSDVSDKARSSDDISFSLMRNTINANGKVSGSDVADYIERAEDLNDEVDTVPFGLETDDGQIVKVYVNAEQADKFEEAMKNMLGLEDDIEEAINRLATEFDIVDVVWPTTDDDEEEDPDADLAIDDTTAMELDPEDANDFTDDNYDVVAATDDDAGEKSAKKDAKDSEEEPDEIAAAADADTEGDDTEAKDDTEADDGEDDGSSDEDDDEEETDDEGKPKKKRKKKKAQPAEPVEDDDTTPPGTESFSLMGRVIAESDEKKPPKLNKNDNEVDSPSVAAAIKAMTEKGLHIAAMVEEPGNIVYIEDDEGDEYIMQGDRNLVKKHHGKNLTGLATEEVEQENKMTIGSRFLSRMTEAEAPQDKDGVKDGFAIPLDSQARALTAKLRLPFAKRLIAFHVMAGVPGRYLNTEDAESTIAGAADLLRKKVSVRRAFVALYEGLATAKGFTIAAPEEKAPVKEGKQSDAKKLATQDPEKIMKAKAALKQAKKDLAHHIKTYDGGTGSREKALRANIDAASAKVKKLTEQIELMEATKPKRGSFIQKLFETVLVELGLPQSLVTTTGPAAVGTGIFRTSEMIEQDAGLERALRLLATRLGIKQSDAAQQVDDESTNESIKNWPRLAAFTTEAFDAGNDAYAQAVTSLVSALGIPDDVLERRRTQIVQSLRQKKQTLKNRAQIMTLMSRLSDTISKSTAAQGQQGDPDEDADAAPGATKGAQGTQGTK